MQTEEILLTIFGASGFWALIELLAGNILSKRTATKKELDDIKKELNLLSNKMTIMEEKNDEQDAKTARARILQFNDELLNDVKHSKESFDDTLAYLDDYEKYCREHPLFKNHRTVAAEENIKRCYAKCMEQRDFIGGIAE